MNCEDLSTLTSWPCRTIVDNQGSEGLMVAPPVTFAGGAVVPLFVFRTADTIEITDDGGLLNHLEASSLRSFQDGRARRGLNGIADAWGCQLTTELRAFGRVAEASIAFQKYLGALFAFHRWEADNLGRPNEELLMTQAEHYLKMLNQEATVRHDVSVPSLTQSYSFPLALNDTLYDSASVHRASSSAKVRKLFDVRSLPGNRALEITIVLDDSGEAEAVQATESLLTQLANVERFSRLEERAKAIARLH